MSGMKNLFGDVPVKYADGPGWQCGSETSWAAAVSIRPQLGRIKAKIVAFLRERGTWGATYDEIARECDLAVPTVCGRMVELVKAEIVSKSPHTRKTASGRDAVVYEVKGEINAKA